MTDKNVYCGDDMDESLLKLKLESSNLKDQINKELKYIHKTIRPLTDHVILMDRVRKDLRRLMDLDKEIE